MPRLAVPRAPGDQRHRCLQLLPPERTAEGARAWRMSRSLRLPSGPRSRAPCWRTRRSRCTSWRTCSPPATSPEPGEIASQRAGTHDYYNQNGLEVFTWGGGSRSVVLMGDAHMRPEDAKVASARRAQRACSRCWMSPPAGPADPPSRTRPPRRPRPMPSTSASNNKLPRRDPGVRLQPEQRPLFAATLVGTPVPGPRSRLGQPCRAFAARSGRSSAWPARSTAASRRRRLRARADGPGRLRRPRPVVPRRLRAGRA